MNIRKIAVVFTLLAVLAAGTVVSAGALTPMHVSSFKAVYVTTGQIKTSTRVLDSLNRPVAGAKVLISFEKDGAPIILRSGFTGPYGYAAISATVPAGHWTVCVEEIHKLGYDYNPLKNLCTAVLVP